MSSTARSRCRSPAAVIYPPVADTYPTDISSDTYRTVQAMGQDLDDTVRFTGGMQRNIFAEEHSAFRHLIRDFIQAGVVPHFPEWESAGQVPHELYGRLGDIGVMGISLPEEYGGGGQDDYRYNAIIQE